MNIRSAVFDDKDTIANLLAQLGYPGTEQFLEEKIDQLLTHPDALLLVAEHKSQVQAFISLHFIPQLALRGDFCRISYFCVDEDVRGMGLGKTLGAAAMQEALARGCDRIEVHCHERRSQAHEFYFRQGFHESPKYLLKML